MLKQLSKRLSGLAGGREISALGDQALVSGANFASNLMLARAMGLHEYGVFALAWMSVLFVNSFQWALVVSPMMSVGPKQDADKHATYYGAVVLQAAIYASLSSACLFGALHLHIARYPAWNFAYLSWPLSFAAFSYMAQEFVRRYFFSVRRSRMALLSDATSYLTQLPLLFWILHRGTNNQKVLWVIGGTSLAGFFVGCGFFEAIRFQWAAIKEVVRRHWLISRWMAPSAFMQWSTGSLFTLAASVYYGAGAAAVLRCTQNIVGVAHIWFLGLDNVIPAETSRRLHRDGLDSAFTYLKSIALRWALITFAFLLTISIAPHFWLNLIYGPRYASFGVILQLNAGLYMLAFFSTPVRAGLQALEYTVPIFWSYLAMTIFSVILAGPAAHTLGIKGAMLGMIGTQVICQSVVGSGLIRRVRRLRRERTLAPQS